MSTPDVVDFSKDPEVIYRARLSQVIGTMRWLSGNGARTLSRTELLVYLSRDVDFIDTAYGLLFVDVPCWECQHRECYVETVDLPWRWLRCVACRKKFKHKGAVTSLSPTRGGLPEDHEKRHRKGIAFLRRIGAA